MNHLEIFSFCTFYLVCFTGLMYLTPLGTWNMWNSTSTLPPLAYTFPGITIPAIGGVGPFGPYGTTPISINWFSTEFFVLLTGVILTLIVAISILNVKVVGTGLDLDVKQITTIVVGLIISLVIGGGLNAMLPVGTPFIVGFILIDPFVALMAYSVIVGSGMLQG